MAGAGFLFDLYVPRCDGGLIKYSFSELSFSADEKEEYHDIAGIRSKNLAFGGLPGYMQSAGQI